MIFEAHYQRRKLILLAMIGLAFIAAGYFMVMEPAGSFDDSRKITGWALLLGTSNDGFGHGIGWACVLMGVAGLPVVASKMRFSGAAMRIDADGIYWHSWSPKPIAWSNIADYQPSSISGQKFISLTLRDPKLDQSPRLTGSLPSLNKALGHGDLSLSAQGLDKSFDEMLRTIEYHMGRQRQPN